MPHPFSYSNHDRPDTTTPRPGGVPSEREVAADASESRQRDDVRADAEADAKAKPLQTREAAEPETEAEAESLQAREAAEPEALQTRDTAEAEPDTLHAREDSEAEEALRTRSSAEPEDVEAGTEAGTEAETLHARDAADAAPEAPRVREVSDVEALHGLEVVSSTARAERSRNALALLADPDTIAGAMAEDEAPSRRARDEQSERSRATVADRVRDEGADRFRDEGADRFRDEGADRFRDALRLRSSAIDVLQQKWVPAATDAAGPAAEASSSGRLLDAASARRLAADARKRERESRAALEAARRSLSIDGDRFESKGPDPSGTEAPTGTDTTGWQRVALVGASATLEAASPTLEAGSPTTEPARPGLEAPAGPAAFDASAMLDPHEGIRVLDRELRRLRAENREQASALALARQSAAGHRAQLAELRETLAEREATGGAQQEHIRALEAKGHDAHANATDPAERLDGATPVMDFLARPAEAADLRDRIARLETALSTRDAERAALAAALSDSRASEANRREQLDALHDRLEAQDRALDAARREYELERERHSRSLELITRLRDLLASAAPDAEPRRSNEETTVEAAPPGTNQETGVEAAPTGTNEETAVEAAPSPPPNDDVRAEAASAIEEPLPETPLTTLEGIPNRSDAETELRSRPADATTEPSGANAAHEAACPPSPISGAPAVAREDAPSDHALDHALDLSVDAASDLSIDHSIDPSLEEVEPPTRSHSPESARAAARVFDHWLDDQVRRHFGPMGIDRTSDLLRSPLARRRVSHGGTARLLLIGFGVWRHAAALAEGLAAAGPEQLEIHVADLGGDIADIDLGADAPLRELLVPSDPPADAEALAETLRTLRPHAIVSHSLLTQAADPDPWLDVLSLASERGSALLFSEGTGRSPRDASDEVRAVGDRIWSLLPERYTRRPDGSPGPASWSQACEEQLATPRNAAYDAIRSRFQPELAAQFGFLAEPFLSPPAAGNFDVQAERDRRFLEQVADLDERRIDSGEAPALHAIALVDPLADD